MEDHLSKVIESRPHLVVKFQTMSLQTHVKCCISKKSFQSVHLKFLDALDHLQNHPTVVKDSERTISQAQLIQTI